MKKTIIVSLLAMLTLIASACTETPDTTDSSNKEETTTKTVDTTINEKEESEEDMMDSGVFPNKIVFTASEGYEGKGEGFYGKIDGETRVMTNFMIEDPKEDYFYEGWIICGGKVISTGKLDKFDGLYENFFSSKEIEKPCQEYVLTLEPNDNDPAPADHVMDGEVQGIAHTENAPEWDQERFAMKKTEATDYTCEDSHKFTLHKKDADSFDHVDYSSGVSTTLTRAKSASGEKFSNTDETLSVWFKGDSAMVMTKEEVVHKECKA